jgi:hypothetical protein
MDNRAGKSANNLADRKNGTPDERRAGDRYILRDARGRLRWEQGAEHLTCDMTVVDISGGGAAVLAIVKPPAEQLAWFSLESDTTKAEPWKAQVITATDHSSGKYMVRLRFTSWVVLDPILERHQERRLWQRYPVKATRVSLLWDIGSARGAIDGELLNISGGGAAVIAEIEPPSNTPLWFKLETELIPIDPVEASLVVISRDPSEAKVIRLSFVDACPMELFEAALNGVS